MQAQDGMRISRTALTLLGMAVLAGGGLTAARAQTGDTTSSSQTGGTMSGQSGTMGGQTGQGGTMSGGRQGPRQPSKQRQQ